MTLITRGSGSIWPDHALREPYPIDWREIELIYVRAKPVGYSYKGWTVNPAKIDDRLGDGARRRIWRGQALGKGAKKRIRERAALELGFVVAGMSNHERLMFDAAIRRWGTQ